MNINKLRQKLLNGYDKNLQPVQDGGNMTKINISAMVIYNLNLFEENETLIIDTFIRLMWTDSRWSWNPDEFGGIDFFAMGEDEAWLPDISIYESIPSKRIKNLMITRPMLLPSGTVIWSPRAIYQSHCPLTFDGYPNNIQTCNITFGSWAKDGISIDLQIEDMKVYLSMVPDNYKWTFLNYSSVREVKYRDKMPNPFVNVIYSFQFRRLPSVYEKIVKPPVIIAMMLMLFMFWLPPSADKKLTLGAASLFILMILLLFISSLVVSPMTFTFSVAPIRSVIYIVISAILSEILVLIVTKLTVQPPKFTDILYGTVGKTLFLYSEETNSQEEAKNPQEVWQRVAMAIDRFLFLLFVIIIIINELI